MLPAPSPTSYGTPAQAARSPSPEPSMNISAADREAAGFRLDEHGLDAVVARHDDARGERVEQHVHVRFGEQLVGGDLERRDVVRLREDLVLDREVGLVQPVHALEPLEDVVGYAVDDLLVLAVNDGMQAAERAQARRRARAPAEAVALDADRRPPGAPRGDRRGDAGRPAADDDDFVVAVHGRLPAGFCYVRRWHAEVSGIRSSGGSVPRKSARVTPRSVRAKGFFKRGGDPRCRLLVIG